MTLYPVSLGRSGAGERSELRSSPFLGKAKKLLLNKSQVRWTIFKKSSSIFFAGLISHASGCSQGFNLVLECSMTRAIPLNAPTHHLKRMTVFVLYAFIEALILKGEFTFFHMVKFFSSSQDVWNVLRPKMMDFAFKPREKKFYWNIFSLLLFPHLAWVTPKILWHFINLMGCRGLESCLRTSWD